MDLEDVKRVGVIGAGLMGNGIGFAFALGGYPTVLSDVSDEVLQGAMDRVRSTADLFVEEGLIDSGEADAAIGRITTTTDLYEAAAGSDFITEAIVERSQDKRALFNKLDEMCPSHTIIVSNTSSLVLSDFGSDVKRQDKIAITHYFTPPAIVPGVEVAKGPGTSEETFELTCALMSTINHVPIRVLKERPGYLLNRIQHAMYREAITMWAEGVATAEDIDLGVRTAFGFRTPDEGPLLHYDLAGVWRWPEDVRRGMSSRSVTEESGLSAEAAEKIRERHAQGKPWLIEPEGFDGARADAYRSYARRLKALYWPALRGTGGGKAA